VRTFKLQASPQFPDVALASVPRGSYSPGKGSPRPPTPPPPEPKPDPPPPTPTPPDPGPTDPKPPGSALAFEAETLVATHSGTGMTVQTDEKTGGGRWLSLDAENAGSWLELVLPDVPAGTYTLKLRYKSNSDRGQLALRLDGTSSEAQVGSVLDQYSSPEDYPTAIFGTVTFASAGNHRVRLVVMGKNAASRGFLLSADAVILE
jgi:hypothetical protein